ncbi:hypothetical protein WJX73_006131 [Symbiochloris irregularis]|uniref:Uncharacterized protein n=1 Tax=Symbiochloris irregularis TaxID=706552 RepID=A0AAW1NY90_9CHLO
MAGLTQGNPDDNQRSSEDNQKLLQYDIEARLKKHAAKSLNKDSAWVEDRVAKLSELLPDLMRRVDTMKANVFLILVANCEDIAVKAVQLKWLLPNSDVSDLIARFPGLLLCLTVNNVRAQLEQLREALSSGQDVELLVAREPYLLAVDIHEVIMQLSNLRELDANGGPIGFLANRPRSPLPNIAYTKTVLQLVKLPSGLAADLTNRPCAV